MIETESKSICLANRGSRTLLLVGMFGDSEYGEIDGDMVGAELARLGPGPVNVLLDSIGGVISSVRDVIAKLKSHPGKVALHVDYEASSAALLLVASFRATASPFAQFFFHYCRARDGNYSGGNGLAVALKETNAAIVETLVSKMYRYSRDDIRSLLARNKTLNTSQCYWMGLIDEILK